MTNKRVLLLGVESDLGRACAQALAEAGATLALIAATTDADAAFAVKRLAGKLGAAVSQAIDAANEAAVRVMLRQVSKELGGLDAVVYVDSLPSGEVTLEQMRAMEARMKEYEDRTKQPPVLSLLEYGSRELDKRGGGPIVLVGSGVFMGGGDEPPKSWIVEVEIHDRLREKVLKDVIKAIRSGRPWYYRWPRLVPVYRLIMRPYWRFRSLFDYQHGDR